MARPRLRGSLLPLVLAMNGNRCNYALTGCRGSRGLVLTWRTPGGDPGKASSYSLACRRCAVKIDPALRTGYVAA